MNTQYHSRRLGSQLVGAAIAIAISAVLFFFIGGESASTERHQAQEAHAPAMTHSTAT